MEYQTGSKKLGEAFNIEGGGQGKRATRNTEKTQNRNRWLSYNVVLLMALAEYEGQPISQDAAFQTVVEEQGEEYETVRKAFQKYGSKTLQAALKLAREKRRDIST